MLAQPEQLKVYKNLIMQPTKSGTDGGESQKESFN